MPTIFHKIEWKCIACLIQSTFKVGVYIDNRCVILFTLFFTAANYLIIYQQIHHLHKCLLIHTNKSWRRQGRQWRMLYVLIMIKTLFARMQLCPVSWRDQQEYKYQAQFHSCCTDRPQLLPLHQPSDLWYSFVFTPHAVISRGINPGGGGEGGGCISWKTLIFFLHTFFQFYSISTIIQMGPCDKCFICCLTALNQSMAPTS